jgi:hypothetical protein
MNPAICAIANNPCYSELSSNYASRYLQVIQSVLEGTTKGNPNMTGETLKEEIDDQYFCKVLVSLFTNLFNSV